MSKPRKAKRRTKAQESWKFFTKNLSIKERRTFPAYAADAIEGYAKLTGEILWASNELQSALSWIFDALVASKPRNTLGIAVWHAVKADSAQRDMLDAAARCQFGKDSRLLSDILWLTDSAGKVSGYRNDAAHTPMGYMGKFPKWEIGPVELAPPVRAERITRHGYKKLFPLVRGDLIALTIFAYRILGLFGHLKMPQSWPRRPRLLSRELLNPERAAKPQQASRSKVRKLQPPSSQE